MTCLNSISPRVSRKKGHPVSSPTKHSTIIYVICLLLICLWFAGMGVGWWVCPAAMGTLDSKAEVTVDAETPAFKQSTQHYFFQNSHSVVESVEEEDEPGVAVENALFF